MLAREIIRSWRLEHDKDGALWGDEELLDYLNDAQEEAALRRARILESRDESICLHSYAHHEPIVTVNPLVLAPLSGLDFPTKKKLGVLSAIEMPARFGEQWEAAVGEVTHLVYGHTQRAVRLYPSPIVDGRFWLYCWRVARPLQMDAEPEVTRGWQRHLRFWVTYRAYMKPGASTYNPTRALEGKALFEDELGPRLPEIL